MARTILKLGHYSPCSSLNDDLFSVSLCLIFILLFMAVLFELLLLSPPSLVPPFCQLMDTSSSKSHKKLHHSKVPELFDFVQVRCFLRLSWLLIPLSSPEELLCRFVIKVCFI